MIPHLGYRTWLRWSLLFGILVVAGLFISGPNWHGRQIEGPIDPSASRVEAIRVQSSIRPWLLGCCVTIVLLLSAVELTLLVRGLVLKNIHHKRSIEADLARRLQLSTRESGSVPALLVPAAGGDERLGKWTKPFNAKPAKSDASRPRPFAGKTVLIADDDFDISQMLVLKFEHLGMTALRTSDALQLLFGAHKVKADLVVLDVNMPTGNGLAVCEMLNSAADLAGLPVIVYTGCSTEATVARCRALGAHYILKAPNSWAAIEAIVYSLFSPGEEAPVLTEEQIAESNAKDAQATADRLLRTQQSHEDMASDARASVPTRDDSRRQQTQAPSAPSPPLPCAAPGTGPGGTHRVLAIHVEQSLVDALTERSAALKITLNSESNPERGYWECLSEMPDIVMVGMGTSDSQAADVLKRLKASPHCSKLPFLAIVGPEEISLGLSGADGILRTVGNVADVERALQQLATATIWRAPKPAATPSRAIVAAAPEVVEADVDEDEPAETRDEVDEPQISSAVDEVEPGETVDAIEEEEPSGDDVVSAAVSEGERRPRLRPMVLVIDDDPDISSAIALRLSAYGVDVLPAYGGMPGYWTAVDLRPDVILCDMRMPEGEGNYIVGRLKSHPLTQDIPIIVITGQDNFGLKRVMMSSGVAAYFSKPIVMKELLDELRRHITFPAAPRGPLAIDSSPIRTPVAQAQ